jgi:hypothetical protein
MSTGRSSCSGRLGGRFHCTCVAGEQATLLRQHLRDVTAEDAVSAVLQDGPRWALELLLGSRLRPDELGRLFAAVLMRSRADDERRDGGGGE